jgi:hypothetical protein
VSGVRWILFFNGMATRLAWFDITEHFAARDPAQI